MVIVKVTEMFFDRGICHVCGGNRCIIKAKLWHPPNLTLIRYFHPGCWDEYLNNAEELADD